MNKCSSQDDSGAKVARKQVDVHGDLEARCATRDDGEEGCQGGTDEDHENGRDACSQVAIVIIASGIQVADDLGWVSRVEVDRGGIKICHV